MKVRKNIMLEKETAKKLDILKVELEKSTYNELIKELLKNYEPEK